MTEIKGICERRQRHNLCFITHAHEIVVALIIFYIPFLVYDKIHTYTRNVTTTTFKENLK